MAGGPGSTLRAQWLGQQLRQMREAAGLTLKDIGDYLHRNPSTVSRIESGVLPARVPEVLTYLDLCGVDDPKRRADLKQMAQDVWQKGWWDGYASDVVGTLIDWVWLESRAAKVHTFEVAVIPGLLQTRQYAEALVRTVDVDASDEQIHRFVDLRMTRQERLTGNQPFQLSAVIDESALRRPVGGPEVMSHQLHHLCDLARRGNIEIAVLPTSAGAHASPEGAFNVFDMCPPYGTAGCISTPAGNLVVEGTVATRLLATHERLRKVSLTGKIASGFVEEMIKHVG